MSAPDLFVVCKNCQAEVSPYITECPYCGQRLRKRAPKIERPDAPSKPPKRAPRGRTRVRRADKPPKAPRLGRLRTGEIPGIRGDEHGKPWATIVLLALSLGLWLALAFVTLKAVAIGALDIEPWFYLTASLVNDGTAAQFATAVGLGLFGWLIERRNGPIVVVLLFLLCGPGALAIAVALDPGTLVFGTHGAALGFLCAWLVPVALARHKGRLDDDADLLGVLVIAAVLLLIPAISQGHVLSGVIGGALGALAGLLLAVLKPAR